MGSTLRNVAAAGFLFLGAFAAGVASASPEASGQLATHVGVAPANWEEKAAELKVSLTKPTSIDLNAYLALEHTKNTATDLALTEYEGQKLFFEGMLAVLASPEAFSQSTLEGQRIAKNYPYLANAPCAYSVTSALRTASTMAQLSKVRDALPIMSSQGPIHTCTVEDEFTFRRMGFNYFDKNKYIAPFGAIGLLND